MTNLKKEIQQAIKDSYYREGRSGLERASYEMVLTEEEKNYFINEIELDANFDFEFTEGKLFISYSEEV